MAVEELHGFCLGYDGVWRFKIPNHDESDKTELKIEPVFTCDPHLLPINMGFFSYGHKVYMVGGTRYHPIFKHAFQKPDYKLHILDSTIFKEHFPLKNPQFLDEPIILPPSKMKPLLCPMVIQSDRQIYFLTQHTNPWLGKSVENICFQSFDSVENLFHVLPSPPYSPTPHPNPHNYSHGGLPSFDVVSLFAACGYIYLIIREKFTKKKEFAFSFDTKASKPKWKEAKSMLHEFRKNEIPIPYLHSGDTGVSEKFPGSTRILVALCGCKPTAYRVTLGSDGSLTPKSFRYLKETNSDNLYEVSEENGTAHLLDIGSGRFCVILQSGDKLPLEVYVFKIDFKAEHELQCSRGYSRTSRGHSSASSRGHSPARTPSVIICSRKLFKHIPSTRCPSFYAYCLASAPPASQSSGNQIAAAEVQDRDGNSRKRDRDRDSEQEQWTR